MPPRHDDRPLRMFARRGTPVEILDLVRKVRRFSLASLAPRDEPPRLARVRAARGSASQRRLQNRDSRRQMNRLSAMKAGYSSKMRHFGSLAAFLAGSLADSFAHARLHFRD